MPNELRHHLLAIMAADAADGFTLLQSTQAVNGVSYGGGLAYQIQSTATPRNHNWTWTVTSARVATIASFQSNNP